MPYSEYATDFERDYFTARRDVYGVLARALDPRPHGSGLHHSIDFISKLVEAANQSVQSRAYREFATDESVDTVLGVTPDGVNVVYLTPGNGGIARIGPFDTVEKQLKGDVERAIEEYRKANARGADEFILQWNAIIVREARYRLTELEKYIL